MAALAVALLLAACSGAEAPAAANANANAGAGAASAAPGKPALTVMTTQPVASTWALQLPANGSIAPWQEASVGAESGGLRVTEVRVNVGDAVRRGQTLAQLTGATAAADVAATAAAVAEGEAALAEARANAERAAQLRDNGFLSPQGVTQALTAERTAAARLEAQRARLRAEQVRQSQTRIAAPDDGVISARSATVGAVVQPGQELFRLIRGARLEWRAEVTAADLARVAVGQRVSVTTADGSEVGGTVRMVAPTIDAATRNGLVYVDLKPGGTARAGMFARGVLHLGESPALTLPQAAVALRDGYSYVYRVDAEGRVAQTKVSVGRRLGERIEILGGLEPQARVVAAGVGFLADGDRVRVVGAAAGSGASGAASAPAPTPSPAVAPASAPRP